MPQEREGITPSQTIPPGTILENGEPPPTLKIPPPHLAKPPGSGAYVAIEGIDGSGKTTITRLLVVEARSRGCRVAAVKEPYYSESKTLLEKASSADAIVEAYLFAADRMLMHKLVLIPLLKDNQLVVSDRSLIASLAYQVARGAPRALVSSLNYHALHPDRIYLLDLEPHKALARLEGRRDGDLRYLETLQARVREEYLRIARENPQRVRVIDADSPPEGILEEIVEDLDKWGVKCLKRGRP